MALAGPSPVSLCFFFLLPHNVGKVQDAVLVLSSFSLTAFKISPIKIRALNTIIIKVTSTAQISPPFVQTQSLFDYKHTLSLSLSNGQEIPVILLSKEIQNSLLPAFTPLALVQASSVSMILYCPHLLSAQQPEPYKRKCYSAQNSTPILFKIKTSLYTGLQSAKICLSHLFS